MTLEMLGGVKEYERFVAEEEKEAFAEINRIMPVSDKKLTAQINELYIKYQIKNIMQLEKGARGELLMMICQIPGASIRQVSRITGVPVSIVRYCR